MRLVLSVCLLGILGCGGGSGGSPSGDDAPTDGPVVPPPDGPGTQAKNIGSACTPDQANPQGDCPAGFACLSLQGGTNPWCSKTCTSGAGDTCATGYTGPGKASCVYQITPQGGGTAQSFCGVVCEDDTGSNQICSAAQCNGSCPSTLACTAPLSNGTSNIAKACQ